ncbi:MULTISPECIES: ArsR/SmtB family transcription factor [Marinomonas]|uniref:ArsR family transcriptional regulator n=2 Tax=Marinomonas TaxID=28253 RepID=A0A366CV15_9GAMM|nr:MULTISPECIES: helix-turn-helix domain-containing protein [Marinomonas]AEF56262.1 regulatory protein ArsR [Marinomonas posidonica IVIA-Po-181]RBO80150.1 ArsR family transcriptional regulator [Marinomonas aquiplantarum]
MSIEVIAEKLAELGHPTRLAILKHLVKAGNTGAPVGEIQEQLDIPGSTLSHHISRMVRVGLVEQVRESRTLYCFPKFDALNEVIHYLTDECCINEEPQEH